VLIAVLNNKVKNKIKYIIGFLVFSLLNFSLIAQPTWQWAKEVRSNSSETILDITSNRTNGNTYVAGYFDDNLSGYYTTGLNGTPDMSAPQGNRDGLVAKYDVLGNVVWAFKIGGVGATVEVEAITFDPNGNVYITGEFSDADVNFQGVTTSTSNIQTPTGSKKDMFLAAYSPNGELIWVSRSVDNDDSKGYGITADANGIYIAGRFSSDITFPPLVPIVWNGSGSNYDGFVIKYDYAGNAVWVKTMFNTTGDGDVEAFNVVTDGTDVFAVGTSESSSWTYGPTGINPTENNNGASGSDDIWVISLNESTSNLNWAQVIGGNQGDRAKGLAFDNDGLYLAGGLGGSSIVFPGIPPVTSIGTAKDIFTCKLFKATGLTDWTIMEQNSTAADAYGTAINIDPSGNMYITGAFVGDTDFNGGANQKSSLGAKDIFVMARKVNGNFLWVETAGSTGNDEGRGVTFDNNKNVYVGGNYDLAATFGAINIPSGGSVNGFVAKLNPCTFSITCPSNQVVTSNASCQYTVLDYSALVSTTATCGVASLIQTPVAGTVVNSGVNPITFILTDNNGNTDTCLFDVVVKSPVNPIVVSCGTTLIGETTVGQGDTENNFSCVGFSTPGEDVYYQVTVPAGNYKLQISISNVVDANDTLINAFWVGGSCPFGGGCIDSATFDIASQQFLSGSNIVQYTANGPGTYYFVVDAQIDGIDSYDISFECLTGVIEFDESTTCGDPDNDGIIATVNGSTTLNVQTCERDTFCYDMYIANINEFQWVDSVYMDFGDCYSNVSAINMNGFYEAGNWVGTYDVINNGLAWQFNNTNGADWGDGDALVYSCDNGNPKLYTYCFTADVSSVCALNEDLDVKILIVDDGVTTLGTIAAGIDKITSTGFTVNNPAPTITCPTNKIVNNDAGNCSAVVNSLAPTINDNCPNPFVIFTLTGATTGSGITDASGTAFNVGITTVKYIVSDSAGLQDSCTFTVTVNDNEVPTITCLSNQTEYACSFVLPAYPPLSLSDNCTSNALITITQKPLAGSTITTDTLITIYATDVSGNIDSCSFTLLLADTINPTIICPGNVSVNNDIGICGAIVNGIAPISSNDNCGIDSVSYVLSGATLGNGLNNASGLTNNLGATTVSYTVTDLSNNTGTCSFTVVVIDAELPTITCQTNLSVNNDVGTCGALVTGIAPSSSNDNCGIDSVSYVLSGATSGNGLNDASGLTFNFGVTTVTYTVTDLSGNLNNCSFNVTVVDNEVPVFTCPPNKNEYLNAGCSFSIPDYTNDITGLSDNCTLNNFIVVTQSPVIGTFVSGHNTTQQITIYAEDLSGNIDSCFFTITLLDTIVPTVVCPGNQTEIVDNNCEFTIPSYFPTTVFDNCASPIAITMIQTPAVGSVVNTDTTITLFANDGNGNIDSCSFQITLVDTISPAIMCPNDTIINNDIGVCGVNAVLGLPFVSENCGISSLINDFNNTANASGLYPLGVTTVIWTVTDLSLNTASCSYNVTIIDVENPIIVCINDTIIGNDINSCDAVFNYNITATDNCSATVSQIGGLPSGSIFPAGNTLNIFIATDAAGLTDTCSFMVTVNDISIPTIACPNDVVICDSNVVVGQPVVSDNCMIASITNDYNSTNNASDVYPIGITAVIWTVTDTSGNFATCTMLVEVEEKPTIANAGEDQNLVFNQNTNLDGNTPLVGNGEWSLVVGNGAIDNEFDPATFLSNLTMGNNIFGWTITNGSCPVTYDEVVITVGGLKVPTGFSPNGDSKNDLLVIPGIVTVASEIIVFNRWGVEVFTVNNYQNDWNGIGKEGKTLPADTYFYTIKLPEYNEEYSGYFVIKR